MPHRCRLLQCPPIKPLLRRRTDKATTETLSVKPSSIMHSSANVPTTVDSVDLKQYAGTWYEVGLIADVFFSAIVPVMSLLITPKKQMAQEL